MRQFITRLRAEYLLRIAIAFSFLYPALAAIQNPMSWIGYFPRWIIEASPVTDLVLLHTFGAIEIVIALWLLFARDIRIPAFIATSILTLITISNFNQIDVLFRDISLALAALALAVYSYNRN